MPDHDGDAAPRRWQEDVEPDLRHRVLEKILDRLKLVFAGKPPPPHGFNRIATAFEQKMLAEANSKEDYLKRVAHKLLCMERSRQPVQQDASGPNQYATMGGQMQPANSVQAIHGVNSTNTTIPQVSPSIHESQPPHTRSLPSTPSGSSPVPKQHMAHPVAPKMISKSGQTADVIMSDQIIKSSPAIVTPSSSGVHSSQLRMQPGESSNQNKLPVRQMQHMYLSSGKATSVTQSQGQQVGELNAQWNPPRQNARGTCMPPPQQLRMNQQGLEVKQEKMDRQNSQMLVAQQANDAMIQTGHPRERNNQQNAGLNVESPLQTYKDVEMGPQPMITDNLESTSHGAIPQTEASMGSAEEVDWREEMFQQKEALKDAYFSELVELDQVSAVPKITKEEYESLPKDKADQYRFRLYMKKRIRHMLNFLQLQKSNIPEHLKGQLPMYVKAIHNMLVFYRRKKAERAEMDTGPQPQIINRTDDPASSSACTRSQQKQPVQSAAFCLKQNTATRTPAASRENHSNILLGVASSCAPVRSPGSAQSLPSNKLQDYCTASPVTKEIPVKVSSPSASAKFIFSSPAAKPEAAIGVSPSVSSPIGKPDLKVASPSPSAKSRMPSHIARFGFQAALPCAPARSTSPSPVAMAGIVNVASPPASVSTLPSPIEKVGVAQAASPCCPVEPALPPLGANSEAVLFASPCASVKFASSENIGTVSASLQQNSAAASNGSTSNLSMPSSFIQTETTDLQAEDPQHGGAEMPVAKTPIDRLIAAVRALSPAELLSSANSMRSVMRMDDFVPPREFDTFEQWTFSEQAESSPPYRKYNRFFETTTLGPESPPLVDTWEFEANAEHGAKKQKTQDARNALLNEIESANRMLIDTIISIADDNGTDGITSSSGGTLIEFSYTAVSLGPDLKSLFSASETPVIMPVKLLVPADYPRSSPVLVNDQKGKQPRNMFSDISDSADVAFRNTLNGIPEPRSIRETVRAWDSSVRQAITEFAQRFGGGTFTSMYGRWESV